MAKSTTKKICGVSWRETKKGFVPTFRWRSFRFDGAEREVPQMLEGERKTVSKYLMLRLCEDVFGEAPLAIVEQPDGSWTFEPNPLFEDLPYVIDKQDGTFAMSDGSSLFAATLKPDTGGG